MGTFIYPQNPRFNHQSEQASESALVGRNADETEKRSGGAGEPPIILNLRDDDNISKGMTALYKSLLPDSDSNRNREEFTKKIEKILNDEWPGKDIKVHMFGSSKNELGTTQSDVDLCVTTQWNGLKNIHTLSNCLEKHGMIIEQTVPKAKVPIVRLSDPNLNLACDINVNNTLALHNTRLIRKYVSIDPRVRPLAMVVKHWARKRVLNDAAKGGTISTYTWTCIILNFLQMRDPPILPVLHKIPHENVDQIIVNGEDASFYENVETLKGFGSKNKESLGGLLFAFFRRMAYEFDYDNHVISLRQGKYLTKAEKSWDTCKGWKMLCVEEPFNTTRNLGNSADDISVNGLREEFRRACDILYNNADVKLLCEEYHFPNQHENCHNYYYNNNRNSKHISKNSNFKRISKTHNGTGWFNKQGNRKFYYNNKYYQNGQQNGQTNFGYDMTDNFHDMNGESNYSQDNEEDGYSIPRFDNVSSFRQNSHYSTFNGSESEYTSVPSIKRINGYYENNDVDKFSACSTRKQIDNPQNRRSYSDKIDDRRFASPTIRNLEVDNSLIQLNNVPSDLKEDEKCRKQFKNNGVNHRQGSIKKKNDERSFYTYTSSKPINVGQFNNYGHQSQDSYSSTIEPEGLARYGKINNQKSDNNSYQKNYRPYYHTPNSTLRFPHSPCSDQKPSYSQITSASYDSDFKHNNSYSRRSNNTSDLDQKSLYTHNQNVSYDSDKRFNYKYPRPNKQEYNLRQVEDSSSIPSHSKPSSNIGYNDSSSNLNFNAVSNSSPKPGYKSNNNNKFRNKNTQINSKSPRQSSENVDLTNKNYPYNYSIPNVGFQMPIVDNGTSSQQQLYHGQSNDVYQRRMSHQSSSDGSNSQTSGNTSNTSYSNSSNYTKNNHQKNDDNQDIYYQQQSQNKPNSNFNKKKKNSSNYNNNFSNSGNGNSRSNNVTTNSSPSIVPNSNDSFHEETPMILSSNQMNQGHYFGDTNGHKVHNGNSGGYNNNSFKGPKIISGSNNNPKSMNDGNQNNDSSNRSVNCSSISNYYSRSNNNNNNNNYYSKNSNNSNNVNSHNVSNNNYSIKNGGNSNNSNNSNMSGQRNSQPRKNNKCHNRKWNKPEKKEDGFNYQQQQYLQETVQLSPSQERQNHHDIQSHQQNNNHQEGGLKQKTGQNSNIGRAKGNKIGQKKSGYSHFRTNTECQPQQ